MSAAAEGAEAGTRVVVFAPGFNGFTYTGGEPIAPEGLLAGLDDPESLLAVFKFEDGAFTAWRPGPAFLNSLESVEPLDALFLQFATVASWEGPAAAFEAGQLSLSSGFNFVPALMTDGAAASELVSGASGVDGVFLLDAATQGYDIYRPAAPAALNTLEALPRFDGVWVLASDETALNYPGFAGPPSISRVDPPLAGATGIASMTLHGTWGSDVAVWAGWGESRADATASAFCAGAALQAQFDPALAATGSVDLYLRSDGATTRAAVALDAASNEGLAAAIASTRELVTQCVEAGAEQDALLAHLDAAAAKVAADDVEGALGDLEAYLGAVAVSESIAEEERAAYTDVGESLVLAVGALIPSLFQSIAELFGALIPIGIFP